MEVNGDGRGPFFNQRRTQVKLLVWGKYTKPFLDKPPGERLLIWSLDCRSFVFLLFSCFLLDECGLFRFIRRAVFPEDIMKPQRRFRMISLFPAVPWKNSLGFPVYKTPVNHGYFIFLTHGEAGLKSAFIRPCHIFCAK